MSHDRAPLRLGFFMAMMMGHKTQYLNWRRVVDAMPAEVAPCWVPIDPAAQPPWLARAPAIPASMKWTLSEYAQLRAGLARGPFDAVVLNPHGMALKHQRALARQPSFLLLDATRKQWNSFRRWYRPAPSEEGWLGSLRLRRQRHALQSATGLFPASHWAAGSLIEDYGVDPARVTVIPIGIDPGLWRPEPSRRPNDGVLRLLFIGRRLVPKGGDLLIEWAKRTSRKNFEVHLVTGERGEEAPGVIWHQASNNSSALIELAQRCDAFVLPTRADCSPVSILEAMSAELPVLASRIGGVSELVQEGRTGWLAPPGDADAWHAALDALSDARAQLPAMGRAARERVLAEFRSDANVRRALDLIAKACDR